MSQGEPTSGDIDGALGGFEASPAIMVACEGENLVLASANEAAREAFGERCQFGRPVREIAPEVDQRTTALMDDMVRTVLATGRSVVRPAHRVEVRPANRPPHQTLWDLTVSPWRAADGSVRGVLATGVDVSDAVRTGRHAGQLHPLVALQDALMPECLPILPGLEMAGRHLLAEDALVAGGDWYDAVGLPDGSVALIVGDIAGQGVAAAAAMGRLRAVAQERLASGAELGQVMRALDAFARCVPDASAATMCVVVLDPVTGRLQYCTAGHPPPLVVRAEGRSRYLCHSGAAPLATTGEMTLARDRVHSGDLVVLYTNGILDRPGRSLAGSTVELGQVAADAASDARSFSWHGAADRVCQQALEAMTCKSGYADDVAILVAEVTDPPGPLHLDLDADAAAVPHAMDAVADWLESMRVRELDHIVVQHAVDELVTNVVEHAYATSGSRGRVTIDAALGASGDVEIRFVDGGAWVPPRRGNGSGHGLSMVRDMVDRLVVRGNARGTVATVHHRVSRPAWLLTGATSTRGRREQPGEQDFTLAVDSAGLHLAGSVDRAALDRLHSALDELVDTGRVVIDLGGVTRLPSYAIQALHAAARDAADRGQELVLYAAPGTTAQHVLELVRLPYALLRP